jgi:hypothetical protein
VQGATIWNSQEPASSPVVSRTFGLSRIHH